MLEGEGDELIDEGLGKRVAFGWIGDELGDAVEELNAGASNGADREDFAIEGCDIEKGIVEDTVEIVFVLLGVERGEEMFGLELGCSCGELHREEVTVGFGHGAEGFLPRVRLGEGGFDELGLVGEFVV